MVLDTSAVVAAISGEPDGIRFQETMLRAPALTISAATALETRIVLYCRSGSDAVRAFDDLLQDAGVVVVPLDDSMADEAFAAFRRFGKGRGHPAQLNIIDCVAYALAKYRGEALLFKGNDFATTDIESAL